LAIIGNFPYNISSQIFFKILSHRQQVVEVVGMVQKEVGKRLAAPPGNKEYGILSVLLQAYYTVTYQFTVKPGVFHPPPKVDSGVITLQRNAVTQLPCDEKKFATVVKLGFNQRRKTLRNALKSLAIQEKLPAAHLYLLDKRAEELSVADFVQLTQCLS
jgi:16S rRNA (adenine1518-N6/adenine1519-N6)-dimethyltransferase